MGHVYLFQQLPGNSVVSFSFRNTPLLLRQTENPYKHIHHGYRVWQGSFQTLKANHRAKGPASRPFEIGQLYSIPVNTCLGSLEPHSFPNPRCCWPARDYRFVTPSVVLGSAAAALLGKRGKWGLLETETTLTENVVLPWASLCT